METVAPAASRFGLELLGVFLADPFLDFARRAFDQVLGLLQAQAGCGANHLDHADLVGAEAVELTVNSVCSAAAARPLSPPPGAAIMIAPPAAGSMP